MRQARPLLCQAWLSLSAIWVALACLPAGAAENDQVPVDVQHGERIYRSGMLASGMPLTGSRSDGVRVSGASAACITCHRASGLGGAEGNQLIPPVIGSVLRAPGHRPAEPAGRGPTSVVSEATSS